MENKAKINRLAELEHEQWMEWSKEIASKEKLSKERLTRWKKLWVPYKDLTELEKEADRAWARRLVDKMSKKRRKPDILLFIAVIGLILFLLAIGIAGFLFGKQIGSDQYKSYAYDMCKGFNFMAYINAENLRHYQNSSFELTTLPNCAAYYYPKENASISYNDWMKRYNMTHLNWTINNTIKNGTK